MPGWASVCVSNVAACYCLQACHGLPPISARLFFLPHPPTPHAHTFPYPPNHPPTQPSANPHATHVPPHAPLVHSTHPPTHLHAPPPSPTPPLYQVDDSLLLHMGLSPALLTPSRINGFINVLATMKRRARMLMQPSGMPRFPSLVITAGTLQPQGAFAEAQAQFLCPDPSAVRRWHACFCVCLLACLDGWGERLVCWFVGMLFVGCLLACLPLSGECLLIY